VSLGHPHPGGLYSYTAFVCDKEKQNEWNFSTGCIRSYVSPVQGSWHSRNVSVFCLPFMNDLGDCSLLRRRDVYVRFFEVFDAV
jgi:hypothetical protein